MWLTMQNDILAHNYSKVLDKIQSSCLKANRNKEDVTLLAVSKFHPLSSIVNLAKLGQRNFAENYLKETKEKMQEIKTLLPSDIVEKIQWHSIGHIQTNKAKDACNGYTCLHTIDSKKLIDALDKVLVQNLHVQNVLIEVNIANEEQKAGVLSKDCPNLVEYLLNRPNFNLQGFMCLPPIEQNAEDSRKYFKALYELKNAIEKEFSISLPHLSMGTSADYQEAILEGATLVRVGTEIFGNRPSK